MATPTGGRDGISIVIPVFNSRAGLPPLIEQIASALDGRYAYEILTVNDDSRDDSLAVLLELSKTYPQLRIIDLAKNAEIGRAHV